MKTIKISEETYEKIKDRLKDAEVRPLGKLEDLIGQTVTLWCARYIYHGTVKSVSPEVIVLEDAGIVYETGDLGNKSASDLQDLPNEALVLVQSVEMITRMQW